MSEEKTILLKVTLDTADLKKSGEEASKKLLELKARQAELKASTGALTPEYAKVSAEIRMQTKVLNDTSKALLINEKLNKTNKGSINEMREALALGTTAYNALSKEERENSVIGKQLQEQNKAISDSLKEQEGAIGDTRRNVGNYGTSLQDLKKELKALKSEMVGLDAGSEEYQLASEKAGKLGDKIKEVNENVKASSGGTGFEKLSNNLGLVQDDLMNLDFAGVSEKMKQMALISKSMTFKEVVGGLKNMGSALLSLGKAILANPMFLIVGAIVAIVGALKMWSDSVKENAIKAQDKHTDSILKTISAMQRQRSVSEKLSELNIRQAELEGKSIDELGKMKLKALDKSNKDDFKERMKYFDAIQSARKSYNLAEEEEDKKKYADKIKELRNNYNALIDKGKTYGKERKVLQAEIEAESQEQEKTAQEKKLVKQQEYADKSKEIQTKLQDLILDNEDLSNENREKLIEAKYKFEIDNANENVDALLDIEKRKNEELNKLDEDIKKDSLARVELNRKRDLEGVKKGSTLYKEINEKAQLEIDRINLEATNKKNERENNYTKNVQSTEAKRIDSARKTAQEIRLIEAETKHLLADNEADKLATFKELQEVRKQIIQENATAEIEAGKKVGAEKELIEKKAGQEIIKIDKEVYTAKKETKENELTDEQKKVQQQTTVALNSAIQLTDALSQITQNRIANELQDEQNKNDEKQNLLTQQLEAGLISDAEYKTKKDALDKEFKAKESKLKKEAFEKEKQANIIKAIMNTAVGVTAAAPVVPLMALAAALGAIQVGLIASQPTPKFAKGGVFGGKSHSNGGTKGVFEDGTQIEVEKDESFFILNKRATPLISQLSNINQSTGGVPLMEKGGVMKFANGGVIANSLTNTLDNQFTQQNSFLKAIRNIPNPVVSVREISSAQTNVAVIENRSIF